MIDVRRFSRSDRDQLTRLANAHIATVMPGWSVPVSSMLAQLERQPGEYIVDLWVIDRATFVAIERDRLAAAAHVLRYADEARVSESYRNAGDVAWLICWPHHLDAGRAVRDAALDQLGAWHVRIQYADGSWLFTHGVAWLRLGGTTRLLAYAVEDEDLGKRARYFRKFGLEPVSRTTRGWARAARG